MITFKCKLLRTALGVFGAQVKDSNMHEVLKQNDSHKHNSACQYRENKLKRLLPERQSIPRDCPFIGKENNFDSFWSF